MEFDDRWTVESAKLIRQWTVDLGGKKADKRSATIKLLAELWQGHDLTGNPATIAVESQFRGQRNALIEGAALALGLVTEDFVDARSYHSGAVKRSLGINPASHSKNKRNVLQWAKARFPNELGWTDHSADAAALCLHHCHLQHLQGRVNQSNVDREECP